MLVGIGKVLGGVNSRSPHSFSRFSDLTEEITQKIGQYTTCTYPFRRHESSVTCQDFDSQLGSLTIVT